MGKVFRLISIVIAMMSVSIFGARVSFANTYYKDTPKYGNCATCKDINGRQAPKAKSQKKAEFDQEAQQCDQDAKEAAKQCDDKTNQSSQQAQGKNDQYSQQQQASGGSSGGGGQGAQGECGGLGDLMKAIEPLLKQAGGQCKGANEKCKQSCKKAQQGQSKCAGLQPPELEKCQGDAQQNQQFGSQNEGSCGAQDASAMAFLAAAANAAMQAAQMAKCKKDTEMDCTKPEFANNEKCKKNDILNCADAKNAQDPKCMCQINPRAAGCPGSENSNDVRNAVKDRRDRNTPGASTPDALGSDFTEQPGGPKAAAGGLPFSPAGGGGGGKAMDGGKGQELGGQAKGLSADVLAGDYGGGGGPKGGAGGGYPDHDPRSAKAMAKAKQAKERRLASQGAWTGANGRSNWEKIKERYRDNRPTFLEK